VEGSFSHANHIDKKLRGLSPRTYTDRATAACRLI
jgi:hypothetical protein